MYQDLEKYRHAYRALQIRTHQRGPVTRTLASPWRSLMLVCGNVLILSYHFKVGHSRLDSILSCETHNIAVLSSVQLAAATIRFVVEAGVSFHIRGNIVIINPQPFTGSRGPIEFRSMKLVPITPSGMKSLMQTCSTTSSGL